jgi:hypothetical protein
LVPVDAARRSPPGFLAVEVKKPEGRENGVQFEGFWPGFLGTQHGGVEEVEFCRERWIAVESRTQPKRKRNR